MVSTTGTAAPMLCGYCGRPVIGDAVWFGGVAYHPQCTQSPHHMTDELPQPDIRRIIWTDAKLSEAQEYINELRAHIGKQDKRIATLEAELEESLLTYQKAEQKLAEALRVATDRIAELKEENAHLRRMLSRYQDCES